MKIFIATILVLLIAVAGKLQAQDVIQRANGVLQNGTQNKASVGAGRKDSATLGFEHRDDSKDSVAITYKYLDSVRSIRFDSTINDFDKYFPVPSTYQYLGNNGAAAYPLIYAPYAKPGWDAGFHAFDVYKFTLEDTKFYKTNHPFTQMGYQLASGKEQMVKALHTQNPKPNLGFGLDYRLISAPGYFITQNTNHKSYRLFSNYQGKRKRYAGYFILVGNTIKSSENGGITADSLLLDPNHKKRFSIPVNLGGDNQYEPNPFNASVTTGNIYKDFTLFLRQTYDIGKKDSIAINDSTTEYLFYPKLRAQHTLTYSTYDYLYQDLAADSTIYQNWYNKTITNDTFTTREKWTVFANDFSLLQFPDTKNSAQFLLAGIKLENITGRFYKTGLGDTTRTNLYNLILHGEYRNKTRNKLWDVLLKGEFYLNGFNSGDYGAYATIGRYLGKKLGYVRLFFNNVNRTPSFIYNAQSAFNFTGATLSKKENITSFGADADNPFISLGFKNYIITNLSYFTDYYHTAQSSKVINLLQLYASKKIKLTKKWSWYLNATVQQTDKANPVKVPLVFTRSRFAYEGTYFKNLTLSTGLEVRYYTPYYAYNYSPVEGKFMPQDSLQLKNRPDVSAFFDFRIKGFTAYIRAENLNTADFSNGFGFVNNNFAAPHYPTQGFMFRFGIQWNFVN